MSERVQKVLSQWGIASRRKAEKMILAGKIKINGRTASLGDKVDLTVDTLQVDGKKIQLSDRPQFVYLLLNKPLGVVSTCSDPRNRSTVIDLLSQDLRTGRGIHPVGRLDFASSGALILTNDGQLTLGLTHPRYHLPKTYCVQLDRSPSKKDLSIWRRGIILDGKKTLPAKIEVIEADRSGKTIEIILTEGRNRQIRRVAELLGYQVQKLHRLAIGAIALDSSLPQGKFRHLKSSEINYLKNSFKNQPATAAARSGNEVYDKQQFHPRATRKDRRNRL